MLLFRRKEEVGDGAGGRGGVGLPHKIRGSYAPFVG